VSLSHIAEIERAVQTMLYPDELYERFLFHLTAAMAARGAAIWRLEGPDQACLSASFGANDNKGREAWDEHRDLIVTRSRDSMEPTIIGPGDPINPSSLALLLQKVDSRCPLVIEVAQRADVLPQALRGYSEFLKQMAEKLAMAKCIPWE
jgi:hypothetical protein